jgi:hypothetical protein
LTERITAAEFRAGIARPQGRRREHKYGARAITVDGHRFPSVLEANRYKNLKLLLRAGVIKDLKLQPRFVLDGPDSPIGAYVADFRYFERTHRAGAVVWIDVVEDAKGVETDVYKLKRALFLQLYPHIDFREIKRR